MPIITENGYEYVGTELKKGGGTIELIIYADKEGGMGLDDCEKISRLIDSAIDELDPIEEPYCLCVSSPGLDRPLKSTRDFERSLGKKIEIKLYHPMDGKKEWTGILKSHDSDGFIVELSDGEKSFLFKDVAIARLHVDISFGGKS